MIYYIPERTEVIVCLGQFCHYPIGRSPEFYNVPTFYTFNFKGNKYTPAV